jgi:hypothetical protein
LPARRKAIYRIIDSKLCVEVRIHNEDDFEHFTSTGVNTPPTAKMTDDGQTGGNPPWTKERRLAA